MRSNQKYKQRSIQKIPEHCARTRRIAWPLGPSLHQRVQRLVVSPTLSTWKGQDKILEPCVLNPVLNVICELIIPHPSPMKVPSALKCVEIKLQLKQGVNS